MAPRRDSGYATLLDALLFLVLVSIAAALVFSNLSRSSSLEAARELRSQRLDTAAIDALLAARPEGRDIGMRIGDRLLAQMVEEPNWDPGLEGVVNDTLARLLGPRYRFNLTAVWRPVPWAGPEWGFEVGPPVAERATQVDRLMTLPVGLGFSELLDRGVRDARRDPSKILDASVEAVRLSLARVHIVYCEPCGYRTQAEDLERSLEERLKSHERVVLEPVKEEMFDVVVNGGQWVFSKAREGRFPDAQEIELQPGTWEVREDVRALAERALAQRIQGLDDLDGVRKEALTWLKEEQLHTNRARIVLAIWQ